MQCNQFIKTTFTCNGAEWKVSGCGEWVMLVRNIGDTEAINHVQPIGAWLPQIQHIARLHHKQSPSTNKA